MRDAAIDATKFEQVRADLAITQALTAKKE
jgi:hypothetical protein